MTLVILLASLRLTGPLGGLKVLFAREVFLLFSNINRESLANKR